MNLLIVGATGTLGRQIARRALDEGHQVKCMVRSYKKAAFLREWGAELVGANICLPNSLPAALEGIDVVIDAATARATDSLSIKQIDWDGKVALIKAAAAAKVKRYIFFSILDAEKYPQVPLMEIKRCTELFLKESGLNYTILRPCGFMQNLIGDFAVPILESQPVWVTGNASPIAYMDTQDIAKFAVKALSVSETENQTFPLVGSKAWSADEIVQVCERLSGKTAKVTRVSLGILRAARNFAKFFEWTWNIADRMEFAEVIATGKPLNASMTEVYQTFGIAPEEITTLEAYLQEYFSRIMKKLKELDYEQAKTDSNKMSRKKLTF